MAKFPCTGQDGTLETKISQLLQYSHWIRGLLTCIEVCLMEYIKGLLCALNKLQDQPACQITNIGLRLLDLAKFRVRRERLLWNGSSSPGSLRALTRMWQRINIGWLKGLRPVEGAASRGKVPPPARGQLPPCLRHRGGLKVGLIPDWFVTGLSFWWALPGWLVCLHFKGCVCEIKLTQT